MVKNLPAMCDICVRSLDGKIPWKREWLTTPVFLPGESHGEKNLAGTVHGIANSQTPLSDFHTHTHTVGSYILIITLKANGLNAPMKRHRLAGWMKTCTCMPFHLPHNSA